MLFFDISDTSIEVVKLSKSFLFGESINAFARGELRSGLVRRGEIQDKEGLKEGISTLLKTAKPKEIKDCECGFTLPDSRAYSHRFSLTRRQDGQTVLGLITAQAERLIPQPFEQLTYDFAALDRKEKGKGEGDVLWVAAPTEIVDGYLKLFGELGFEPKLAVPESYAVYSFLAPTFQPAETVLYIDVGEKVSIVTFMDKEGVVGTFSEPVDTAQLLSQVGQLLAFGRKRLGKDAGRIVLGGGGSLKIDPVEAEGKLGMSVALVETAFDQLKLSIKTDFGGLPRTLFANVLGLAALSKEENPLNLLKG